MTPSCPRSAEEVLTSVAELIWAPLLRELARRSWLPANWRQIVRSALFCCPMLVTNLLAADRPSEHPFAWPGAGSGRRQRTRLGRSGRYLVLSRRGGAVRLAEVRELIRLQRPELDPVQRVIARCHSVEDVRQAARRRLPRAVFDYVDGGADAENTLAANRTALAAVGFPAPDPARRLRSGPVGRVVRAPADGPVGPGPNGLYTDGQPGGRDRRGDGQCADGVAVRPFDRGLDVDRRPGRHRPSPAVVPVVRVARPERSQGRWWSAPPRSGYKVLEVSVDTHVAGNRARDVRNGLTIPPQLRVRTVLDIGRHLGYWTTMLRSPMLTVPNMTGPSAAGASGRRTEVATAAASSHRGGDGSRHQLQVRPVPRLGRPLCRSASGGPARCCSKGPLVPTTRCGPSTPASTGSTCPTTAGVSSTGRWPPSTSCAPSATRWGTGP